MSLRFKALRSSSNYNKTQFADLMQVAYRTVTNWEKKDGVIPSLSTISSIAKALHVPTYTVYDCFMILKKISLNLINMILRMVTESLLSLVFYLK